MLRCPPSRISLTAGDLNGLDERLAARHSARLARQRVANVRLARGPQHSTGHSIVPADSNIGRKRARSSASEAVLCDNSSEHANLGGKSSPTGKVVTGWPSATSTPLLGLSEDQPDIASDPVRTLENVVTRRQSPLRSYRRGWTRDRDSLVDRHTPLQHGIALKGQAIDSLDGVLERVAQPSCLDEMPSIPPMRCDREVLADIHHDLYPEIDRGVPEPPVGHRLLSSARARRRHVRSHEIHNDGSPTEAQRMNQYWNTSRNAVHGGWMEGVPPSVPELVLHDEDSYSVQHPMLDPGAPAFVPRAPFGTVTRSLVEGAPVLSSGPHWGSLDSTRNASNLRIRSTSEQNIELQAPHAYSQGRYSGNPPARYYRNDSDLAEYNQIPRRSSHNPTTLHPAQNLERYPPVRPSSGPAGHHQMAGGPLLSNGAAQDRTQTQRTATPASHSGSGQGHRQPHFRIHPAFVGSAVENGSFQPRTRSASPAVSTTSRSTPNLLFMPTSAPQISSRVGSWSWSRSSARPPYSTRVPSMVSAASGVSSLDDSRRSCRHELDAAEEFIRRRNSPLDELTERFSRMRSVGRSWERPPGGRSRPSLLTGDIFGQGPATTVTGTTVYAARVLDSRPNQMQRLTNGEDEEDVTGADPVALSLALPPSSPLPSGAQLVPSSSPLPSFPASPRPPLAQLSPTKAYSSSTSPIRRKPLPSTATTPKLSVYDDNQPPHTQPQTPADAAMSRRRRLDSVSEASPSPIISGSAFSVCPSDDPHRHTIRDNHSSVTTSQTTHQTAAVATASFDSATAADTPTTSQARRGRTRVEAQSSSEQAENDLDGQLHGLEEDRRTWLSRHGAGTLDTTPPKEGRFERFLS